MKKKLQFIYQKLIHLLKYKNQNEKEKKNPHKMLKRKKEEKNLKK